MIHSFYKNSLKTFTWTKQAGLNPDDFRLFSFDDYNELGKLQATFGLCPKLLWAEL